MRRMLSLRIWTGLGLAALLLLLPAGGGCSRNFTDDPEAEVPPGAGPVQGGQSSAQAPPRDEPDVDMSLQAGDPVQSPGIAFTIPEGWIAEPPDSDTRLAQYRLPSDLQGREAAEVAVFYFQGQGGSAQANIDRWIGMFSMPDGSDPRQAAQVGSTNANGIPLTTLDISGTYNKSVGPPMAGNRQPFPGYRMLAAVAETSAGPYFFRLTGPAPTVEKWEESYQGFLTNLQPRP